MTGQLYNPVEKLNGMITDIENYIEPLVYKSERIFKILDRVNIYLVAGLFVLLMAYMFFIRHHRILHKLKMSANYFAAGALLIFYMVLTETPMRIGPELNLNFGLAVMPMASKLFGPILAGAFGIIQYGASFAMHSSEEFNLSAMFVAGISGIIYGWILYARKTGYLRCLCAKLVVNILCNIVLVPVEVGEKMSEGLAEYLTQSIVFNLVLAPLQALIIYVALLILKKVKKALRDTRWRIGN